MWSLPKLAPLRHADRLRACLFIGVDRKWPAHRQGDANDPQRTLAAARETTPQAPFWPLP